LRVRRTVSPSLTRSDIIREMIETGIDNINRGEGINGKNS
jgi:hypothetical protein